MNKQINYVPIGEWAPELWEQLKADGDWGDLRTKMILIRQWYEEKGKEYTKDIRDLREYYEALLDTQKVEHEKEMDILQEQLSDYIWGTPQDREKVLKEAFKH